MQQFQPFVAQDPSFRMLGEIEASVDGSANRPEAEVTDGEPDLDGAAHARELQSAVGHVHLARGGLGIPQVVRVDLERPAQQVGVAHQHRPAIERLIEPLVRIESHRVRELDTRKLCAAALGQRCEPSVCPVDVKPQSLPLAYLRQPWQRIDDTGVRGPARRRDEERLQSLFAIDGDSRLEVVHGQTEVVPSWQDSDAIGSESQRSRRAGKR